MIDRSKRYLKNRYALDGLPALQGKKLYFNSMAEMIATRAQEIPDNVHVYYYDQVITYAQTNERANRVANYLKKKGVEKGDIVSVMVLNSPEIYYSMFGAQKLGAIAGTINYMLKSPEIAYALNDSKPKVAFIGSEFMTEFAKGWELAQHKPVVVEVVTGVEHTAKIAETTLAEILASYPADEALVPQSLDDPFILLYSSGTTGYPKGVLLSNRNALSICKDTLRLGAVLPGDVAMLILPMFHINPLCVRTYPYTYAGISVCIRKAFSPQDFWPAILQYGVTHVMGVPAMYAYVVNAVDSDTIDLTRLKLRYAYVGAAPLPKEVVQCFKDKFGVLIVEGYGLTEVAGVSATSSGAPIKPRSSGQAFFEQEIEILDDSNNVLPCGDVGEICIRGEAVMLGYLNKPEATAETIKEGWLRTGDLGTMDEEGYLFYAGRKKEMINRGGENIYPREIEIVLEAHPKVAQVAVIGVPDPALGERVKACVILKEPSSMTAGEVKESLKDKIANYKIPEFVEFYTEFPSNPTGKIMKGELRKMHK